MAKKQGVIWSYIMIFFEMLSSILFTPFLIRSFGQAEYGIYSLVLSVTSYLALLDLGVGNAIVRFISKYKVLGNKEKQENILAATTLFYAVIGVAVLIISIILRGKLGLIFGKGLNTQELERANVMLGITTANMALTFIAVPFNKAMVAYEKFALQQQIGIIKIVLRVLISVIVLLGGGKGIAIVAVNFCMTILFSGVSVGYVTFVLKLIPKIKGMDISFFKEIFSYSAFIFIQMIATHINAMADQILIGMLVQSSAVILGIYAVGAQINQYFQSIAGSVNGVLMPSVVALVEKKATTERLLDEMVRIGRMLFIFLGIIWAVFLVFGDMFIVLWAGEENYQAYFVAILLITPIMLSLIQSIGTQILWAMDKHKIQAYLKISVAVLNIFLSIFLIKWNPLIGASVGTAIAIIFGDIIVMNIVFRKDIGISMMRYYTGLFKGIGKSLLITIIIGFIVKRFINVTGWFGLIFYCGVMVVCYAGLMWFKGFNQYEKDFATRMIKSLTKRC